MIIRHLLTEEVPPSFSRRFKHDKFTASPENKFKISSQIVRTMSQRLVALSKPIAFDDAMKDVMLNVHLDGSGPDARLRILMQQMSYTVLCPSHIWSFVEKALEGRYKESLRCTSANGSQGTR